MPTFRNVIDQTNERQIANYLRQKRHEFVETTVARLEVLDHELARMNHQALEEKDEIRHRWYAMRQDLTQQRRAVSQQLDELQSRAVEAWSPIAHGIDDARQDLSAAIARARKQLQLPR